MPDPRNNHAQIIDYWHTVRRILVTDNITEETLERVSRELISLDYTNSDPITLMIGSHGGEVKAAQQIEDVINSLNSPVDGLVIGDCASMAVDLLQMCRQRFMLPSARLLVHYIRNKQGWICDDLDQLEVDLVYFRERAEEIMKRRLELYTRRTGLSPEKVREIFRHGEVHQAYFSAKQSLGLGLVDKIVADFKFFPR